MAGPRGAFEGILGHGLFGVQLFFVASALTLAMSVRSRSRVEAHPVRAFFLRRFFRIAPLYYFGIFFYAIYDFTSCSFRLPPGSQWPGYVVNGLLMHGWSPRWMNNIVPGGWSIGTEVSFYLLFPLLFWLLAKSVARTSLALVAATIVGIGLSHYVRPLFDQDPNVLTFFLGSWLPAQLPVFLWGVLLFVVIQRGELAGWQLSGTKARLYSAISLGAAAAVFLLGNRLMRGPGYLVALSAYGAAFGCFGFALYLHPWWFLVNPLTTLLGQLSYSLYMTHWISIHLATPWMEALLRRIIPNFFLANDLVHYGCLAGATVTSLGFAFITYHLIEQPGIRLGRQILQRYRRAG